MTAAPQPRPGAVAPVRLTVWISGRVHGVGMRWWVRSRALELGLVGWARNLADGRVEVVAEGPEDRCRQLAGLLAVDSTGRRPGAVDAVVERLSDAKGGLSGFVER
jgi:acylphosphatase